MEQKVQKKQQKRYASVAQFGIALINVRDMAKCV